VATAVAGAGANISTGVFPTSVVKTPAIEVSSVVSFEEGAVVSEVDPVAVVTIVGRVVVVSVAGVFGLANIRSGIVTTVAILGLVVYGCGLGINRCGSGVNGGRSNIHPGAGDTKADMGIYVHLRIAFGSDEASGYNSGENNYLFHICRF